MPFLNKSEYTYNGRKIYDIDIIDDVIGQFSEGPFLTELPAPPSVTNI